MISNRTRKVFRMIGLFFIFPLFALSINGQQIPDAPPPFVGDVVNFAPCMPANAINRVFCNQPADRVCESTELVRCTSIPGVALTIETCGTIGREYCNANVIAATETTPASYGAGNAQCSSTRTPGCLARRPTNFTCMQAGVVPDPDDCQKYYYCPSVLGVASPYSCPNGYAFDPSLHDAFPCIPMLGNRSLCITANCSLGVSQVLPYRNLPSTLAQIGFRCIGDAKVVQRCGPNTSFIIGASPPACAVNCISDGQRYADPTDVTRYLVCILNAAGTAFANQPHSSRCPFGQIWDVRNSDCVQNLPPVRDDATTTKNVIDTLCPPDLTTSAPVGDCPIRAEA